MKGHKYKSGAQTKGYIKNNVTGKTIHVADKGLNCAQNIAFSRKNGDGYLFSKSVKSLPETEKTWVLLENGFLKNFLMDDFLKKLF